MSTQQRRAPADQTVARTPIRKLQHTATALSLAALLSATAHAQHVQPATDGEDKGAVELDTAVVIGIRSSVPQAQAINRNTGLIVASIKDIGGLPRNKVDRRYGITLRASL